MARPSREEMPATLGELMGKDAQLQKLEDLPEVLGEKMPEIEFNQVGRLRLMRALRNRFGEGFRNIPGIKRVLEQFDDEVRFNSVIQKNRRSRNG